MLMMPLTERGRRALLPRNEARAELANALERRTGRRWSFSFGRRTTRDWIFLTAPARRRTDTADLTGDDRAALEQALGTPVPTRGVWISPADRHRVAEKFAEKKP